MKWYAMPMQPSLNWEPAMSGDHARRFVGERLSWLAGAAAAALFALSVLLIWRRAAHAIHAPLPAAGIAAAGVLLAGAAWIAHWAGRLSSAKKNNALIAEIALSLALFAVAAALSLPGTPAAGLSLFWLILLVEEGWAWRTRLFRVVKRADDPAAFRASEAPAEPRSPPDIKTSFPARQETRAPKIVERAFDSTAAIPPEGVTQQLTRGTDADGTEELAGWLRIAFAAGQRTLSAHLAFCPPFARTPELSVEQIDGPETRIKTAQVLPYGARLDLKLHAPPETPAAVVLQFSARLEAGEKQAHDHRPTPSDQRISP